MFESKRVQVLPARWSIGESFEQYMAVVDNDKTREFETAVHEGAKQWFRCVASPMHGAVALWFTDITTRKNDERLLQEAGSPGDEFLATLAHELRNPLAPIRQASAVSRLPQTRRNAEALEPRGDRAPGAPHGAAAGRAGRLAHHARPPRRERNALAEMIEAAVLNSAVRSSRRRPPRAGDRAAAGGRDPR